MYVILMILAPAPTRLPLRTVLVPNQKLEMPKRPARLSKSSSVRVNKSASFVKKPKFGIDDEMATTIQFRLKSALCGKETPIQLHTSTRVCTNFPTDKQPAL